MHDESVFWPSAASAVLGALVGAGVWAATAYALGVFDCGAHAGTEVHIPQVIALAASVVVIVAGARGSNGSVPMAIALFLPLLFVTSVFALMMMLNVFTADCHGYRLEFW